MKRNGRIKEKSEKSGRDRLKKRKMGNDRGKQRRGHSEERVLTAVCQMLR